MKPSRPRFRFLKGFFLALLFILLASFAVVSVLAVLYLRDLSEDLPTETEMLAYKTNVASVIYDRNGEMIARLFTENRQPVELKQISPWIIKSTLAAEDSSFYQHRGFRLTSIARSLLENLSNQRVKQGGSTITQQLARNLFLTQERTMERKIKELILAVRMEKIFSKDKIMEMYMNTIYFGHGAWGVDTASRTYFGKPSSQITLAEAAILAGLIAAPNRYSPLANLENAKARQAYVLDRLKTLGWIDESEKNAAYEMELELKHIPNKVKEYNRAPYFVSHILFNELLPRYGTDLVYGGGLEVHTTLDLGMQQAAEKALEGLQSQGAIAAIDPETGEILAMAGGHDFTKSKFNRVTQAFRQPGSAFKPVVYAAAFEKGLLPTDHILDAKISYDKKGRNMTTWSPSNYDGKFRGEVTLEYALVHSLNTVVVRLIDYVGIDDVLRTARDMGFTSPHLPGDLSLALGSASVTPLEMATAFSVFANNGKTVSPFAIREVKSAMGDILERNSPSVRRSLSTETAVMVRSVLLDAVRSGTGRRALLEDRETFGKTGTTNDFTDAWFLGGVPGLVAVVYAGNDDHTPLGKKGMTGGVVSAPIWKDFVSEAVKGRDLPVSFHIPADAAVEPVKICRTTGYRAIPGCSSVTLSMPAGKAPRTTCPIHGGDQYASAQDENAPRLVLVHNDSVTYAAVPGQDGTILSMVVDMVSLPPAKQQPPDTAVPDTTAGYKDPNPASSVEERYQNLLKQYGITN